ncbi:MAG: dUTP diphosphatase [Cyclobacteriaceae bacterium]|jgi:dUTP pyrophosphatase
MKVKIVNESNNPTPEYQTAFSAGMDIHAFIEEVICLKPMHRMLIPTGLYIELPSGYEAQIRPRSGLAVKHGITVLNTPGTIDADYRGEIKVILINLSEKEFTIRNGDRIGQIIVNKFEKVDWEEVNELKKSEREAGGFGSTGT